MLEIINNQKSPTVIKVFGIGGAGMNAVNRMISANLEGVEFIAINTDEQVLARSEASLCISIGQKTTKGMGAGGDPEIGYRSAMEDQDKIAQALVGADMVFITAGLGGGTGTGAAPIIAQIAKNMGILVIGVVTLPFQMEGIRRMSYAKKGLEIFRANVDTLITIKNDSIFKVIEKNTSVELAFRTIDDILLNAVRGISDLINCVGIVNVDFADVKSVMSGAGEAVLGAGEGFGTDRANKAVEQAIHNALLEESGIEGATAALINVCASVDLSMVEWNELTKQITQHLDPQANIIVGLTIDASLNEKVRVTVIATGFNTASRKRVQEQKLILAGQNKNVWSNNNQINNNTFSNKFSNTILNSNFDSNNFTKQNQNNITQKTFTQKSNSIDENHEPKVNTQKYGLDFSLRSSKNLNPNLTSEELNALHTNEDSEKIKEKNWKTDDLDIPAFLRRKQ